MRVVKREKLSSTITNCHARGQTGKTIIKHHGNFEHVQSEWEFMIVEDSVWLLVVKRPSCTVPSGLLYGHCMVTVSMAGGGGGEGNKSVVSINEVPVLRVFFAYSKEVSGYFFHSESFSSKDTFYFIILIETWNGKRSVAINARRLFYSYCGCSFSLLMCHPVKFVFSLPSSKLKVLVPLHFSHDIKNQIKSNQINI